MCCVSALFHLLCHPLAVPASARSLEECLRNEYRAAMRMTTKADGHFFEGVRAFVVDRDNKVRPRARVWMS